MWKSPVLAAALWCFCFPFAVAEPADDQEALNKLIALGIKSLGGEDKLAKITSYEFTIKAQMGDQREWLATYRLQDLDTFRVEGTETEKDKKGKNEYLLVVNAKEGWIRRNGSIQELKDGGRLQIVKDSMRFLTLNHSLLLLRDPKAKLKSVGEIAVNNQPALGIRISGLNKGEMTIYLDKKTGLPAKIRYLAFDETEKTLSLYDEYLSEYKEIGGVMVPTRVVIEKDGMAHALQKISDFKLVDKFADKLFTKPDGTIQ